MEKKNNDIPIECYKSYMFSYINTGLISINASTIVYIIWITLANALYLLYNTIFDYEFNTYFYGNWLRIVGIYGFFLIFLIVIPLCIKIVKKWVFENLNNLFYTILTILLSIICFLGSYYWLRQLSYE